MIFMYFGQLKYVTFFQRHFPVRRRSLWIPAEPHYPAPFVSLFYEAHCAASIMGLTPASACPALCPSPCVSSSAPTRLPLARSQVVPSRSCLGRRGCLAMPPTSSISAWVLQGVWSRRSWEGGFSCAPLCIPVGEENVGARLLSPSTQRWCFTPVLRARRAHVAQLTQTCISLVSQDASVNHYHHKTELMEAGRFH